jgi:hypothetical protein
MMGRRALAGLLCLAVAVWSLLPATSHAPAVFETIEAHARMVAEHGHSHGFEHDMWWALHGHSHDTADTHDHGAAVLTRGPAPAPDPLDRSSWRLSPMPGASVPPDLPERPPRA